MRVCFKFFFCSNLHNHHEFEGNEEAAEDDDDDDETAAKAPRVVCKAFSIHRNKHAHENVI